MTHAPLDSAVYRSLFAAYPDALLLVDAAGTIVLANPMAAELLGYTAEELAGSPVDALVPEGLRGHHAGYRAAYARAPRARPMGTQMELSARRKDGSEVMVEIALSPLDDAGTPLVVAAIRGVGAYPRVRQALQRARYSECVAEVGRLAVDTRDPQALLDRVPEAAARTLDADTALLYRLDASGLELRVAASFALRDGDAPQAPVPNRPDTPPGYALAQGRPVIVEDYRQEQRFAVPREILDAGFVSAIAVPLSDRGRTIGVLTVRSRKAQRFGDDEVNFLQSLSNLLASSLQRAEGEEQLAHAARLDSVGQLTGGIAHDFNNLLTVILGNLEVLEELPELQGGATRQLVDAASRASRRGAELTGKLLAFSRRQLLQPQRVDVAALLHSLAGMLRRTLDQRIRIVVDAAADCPPVLADPGQLESALLNIAINARDAMPGGGLLTFAARADDDQVAIAVGDSGGGMSPDVRERAFEPFFTTKEKGRGTGLGLSTVYGFVMQSRGSVELDSVPGRGTTVTLRIPRWRAAAAAGAPAAEAAELPAGLRVLLVEDDADVRQIVQAHLGALGCLVTCCANGEQALALLDADDAAAFDVLLSDIALGPGMRGTELARRAEQRAPGLAVLLMSGFAAELLEAERNEPLPWEMLHKPYGRDELARALARALAAR